MPASVAEARKAAHEAAHAADAQRQQMRLDEIVGAVIRLVPREEPLPTPPCPSDLLYDT